MCAARLLRISAANIGPNRFHQNRMVSSADVDPALRQEILDVAQRQRVSHIHHHHQTNDFWRAVEIPERVAHGSKLPQPGKAQNWSDKPSDGFEKNRIQGACGSARCGCGDTPYIVAVALANKNAQIAWSLLTSDNVYDASLSVRAA